MIYKKINKNSNTIIVSLINKYKDQPLLIESHIDGKALDAFTFIFIYKNIFLTLENLYLKDKKIKEVHCYKMNYRFGDHLTKKISKEEFLNLCSDVPDFSDWILFNIDKIK